MDQYNG
ncbi:hypothetical protein RDI58_005529 [Solanum bulbocastanum]